MSFIDMFAAALGAIQSDVITVHDERCISVRNRNAHCARCAEACTSGCITLADNQLEVDPGKCIGCGTCATACPTSAIEIVNPSDSELTDMVKDSIIATKGHPVITCAQAVGACGLKPVDAAPAAVVLPCLGRVDESLLAGLAAYKSFDATLACGNCDACAHTPGGILACDVVESAQSLVRAFGSPMTIEVVEGLPERVASEAQAANETGNAHRGGLSRRDALRNAKEQGRQAAQAAVRQELDEHLGASPEDVEVPAAYRKVGANGTLSHYVPTRRTRLYNYLRHIGAGQPVVESVESRVIGAVSIDANACTSCRMCAVFCPTGAIEKLGEPADAKFGVVHRPAACMQCRLCESICPAHAIHVSGSVPTAQFMGKQAVVFPMQKPEWTPNTPTSMFDKIHAAIGQDVHMSSF